MALEKGTKFSDKHGPNAQADPVLKDKIMEKATYGNLACAVAFKLARELGVSPAEIGKTVDLLDLRLSKCQLGLFGYQPEKKAVKAKAPENRQMEEAIRNALKDGRLACSDTWDIAGRFKVPKMAVSGACESLGIKIKPCQLGAF
ncbi:hypothetical protein D1AOALGA4SA_7035 [Olavius algarvensis Delta 1 endosymbiont]|nr:hypothetical protein D1AOALGA4SA_7035 [Olavius algarvensis Delta 1 endosymbiont]